MEVSVPALLTGLSKLLSVTFSTLVSGAAQRGQHPPVFLLHWCNPGEQRTLERQCFYLLGRDGHPLVDLPEIFRDVKSPMFDHKGEELLRWGLWISRRLCQVPMEGFLRPVDADSVHPALAPMCVWYMEAFLTLGGVLSVCFTVSCSDCCWDVVAIGASLLSFTPPLPPLLLCFCPFLFLSSIPHTLISLLFTSIYLCESSAISCFYSSLSIQSPPLPLWPSFFPSSSAFIVTFHTITASLNQPVGVLAAAVQSRSLVRDRDESWRVTTGVEGGGRERGSHGV